MWFILGGKVKMDSYTGSMIKSFRISRKNIKKQFLCCNALKLFI